MEWEARISWELGLQHLVQLLGVVPELLEVYDLAAELLRSEVSLLEVRAEDLHELADGVAVAPVSQNVESQFCWQIRVAADIRGYGAKLLQKVDNLHRAQTDLRWKHYRQLVSLGGELADETGVKIRGHLIIKL